MVKACRKNKSKRQTLSKKYKIIRKVKEHHRKLRKEKKANPKKFRRKDPGIPNSLPFKEEVIQHVDETKKKFIEIRKNQFLAALKARNNPTPPKEDQLLIARKSDASQMNEFRKVIQESDVILEVVDSRDPIGTRCVQTEQEVINSKKKLVIILNKIDLIPKENVKEWLNYFRESYPTLPFKANTQNQSSNLGQSKKTWIKEFISDGKNFKSQLGIGVNGLMALLGNYARHKGIIGLSNENKTNDKSSVLARLVVGIVGLPNTGKSAIVNTLKRRKVSTSSNCPGETKQAQLFQLDKHIYLYDSPGIVLSSNSLDASEMVLKNCRRPDTLDDPTPAAEAILRRVPKRQLIIRYGIQDYASVSDFLVQFAMRQGKLKKGGVPHIRSAAQKLIQDWITGRITYYTHPPTCEVEKAKISSLFKASELPQDDLKEISFAQFDDEALSAIPIRDMNDAEFCQDAVLKNGEPIRISTLHRNNTSNEEMETEDDEDSEEDDEDSEEDDDVDSDSEDEAMSE